MRHVLLSAQCLAHSELLKNGACHTGCHTQPCRPPTRAPSQHGAKYSWRPPGLHTPSHVPWLRRRASFSLATQKGHFKSPICLDVVTFSNAHKGTMWATISLDYYYCHYYYSSYYKLVNSLEVSLTVQKTEASVSITALPDQKHFSSRLRQPKKLFGSRPLQPSTGRGSWQGPERAKGNGWPWERLSLRAVCHPQLPTCQLGSQRKGLFSELLKKYYTRDFWRNICFLLVLCP